VRFAYLDESGDLSVKRLGANSGTTDYFVVVFLLLDDPIPLHVAIDAIKERFGMPRQEEFKFSKTSPRRRRAFLEELRQHDIVVRAVAVNKALLVGRPETANERLLYRDMIRRTLVRHQEDLGDTELVLDEYIRGRQAQHQFNALLRRAVNGEGRRRLAGIDHQTSSSSNLIQAADMVAGAIYRARAHNDNAYLQIIQNRVRDLWDWSGLEEAGAPETASAEIPEPPKRKRSG
jgi:hypothetical protein